MHPQGTRSCRKSLPHLRQPCSAVSCLLLVRAPLRRRRCRRRRKLRRRRFPRPPRERRSAASAPRRSWSRGLTRLVDSPRHVQRRCRRAQATDARNGTHSALTNVATASIRSSSVDRSRSAPFVGNLCRCGTPSQLGASGKKMSSRMSISVLLARRAIGGVRSASVPSFDSRPKERHPCPRPSNRSRKGCTR